MEQTVGELLETPGHWGSIGQEKYKAIVFFTSPFFISSFNLISHSSLHLVFLTVLINSLINPPEGIYQARTVYKVLCKLWDTEMSSGHPEDCNNHSP